MNDDQIRVYTDVVKIISPSWDELTDRIMTSMKEEKVADGD